MDDNINDIDESLELRDENLEGEVTNEESSVSHTDYDPTKIQDSITHHLSGMYQTWFLDYASSAILDRAIPHIEDGFKPVQRRIMHSMKRMDDGRYNKVANIVGHTMQFHPHGDASIKDALVQLGQKELLIDCQGNWGNILMKWCSTRRQQNGCCRMTDVTKNLFLYLSSSHYCWLREPKELLWGYRQKYFLTTLMSCARLL